MKLVVDLDKCQGHGKCYLIAPDLFEPSPDDAWGKPVVRVQSVDPADGVLFARAQEAESLCPEFAISLQSED